MNIFESITKIMEEVPAIKKNKKNAQQNFMFRGIDDVMNTFQPLFAKHKVFMIPQVLEQKREERMSKQGALLIYSICKIKYTFYAEDGSYVEAIVIGEGMDSGDKATNKSMAGAMKYTLFQTFCIPTEDDPDSESQEITTGEDEESKTSSTDITSTGNEIISSEQAKILEDLMKRKGLNPEQQLMANYGVKSTTELTQKQRISILKAVQKMADKK